MLEKAEEFGQQGGGWHIEEEQEYQKAVELAPHLRQVNKVTFLITLHDPKPVLKSNIIFKRLIQLIKNNIRSVEFLPKVQAYSLRHLLLTQNHIVSVKVLRKCYFPYLKLLYINDNPIVDIKYLEQFYLKSKQIALTIEDFPDPVISYSFNFLAKLQSSPSEVSIFVCEIDAESEFRISNKKLEKMLRKRRDPQKSQMIFRTFNIYGAM